MADKVVSIPGVGNVAFPDTMSDNDINTQSARLYAQSRTPSQMANQALAATGISGGAAPPGAPSIPQQLQGPAAPPVQPMSATERRQVPFTSGQPMPGSFEGKPENVGQYVPSSFGEIYGGVRDIGRGDVAGGLHRMIGGAGVAASPMAPFALPAAVSAPIATVGGLAVSYGGQRAAEAGAAKLGATPQQQALAGDVGSFAAPYMVGKGAELVQQLAGPQISEALRGSAERNWYKVLNPTTRANKAIAQNTVAPGLAERGTVASSLSNLRDTAIDQMEKHNAVIDDYMMNNGNVPVQGQGGNAITSEIDKLIAQKQRGGVTPQTNQSYIDTLNNFKQEVGNLAASRGGNLTLDDARWLRQQYDTPVAAKNAFALPPVEASRVDAMRDAGNTLRGVIADQNPALADANREFSFWKRTHDVADATLTRRVGQKPGLTQQLAQVGGAVIGSPGGIKTSYISAKAMQALSNMRNSTLWNSLSATTKNQFADMAANGDLSGMSRLAAITGFASIY